MRLPSSRWFRVLLAVVVLLVVAWPFTDLDRDALSAHRELRLGSSPFVADSDGDGLTDGHEVELQTDPRAVDSDGDNLDDGFEHARGMDPLSRDSDADGVPDDVEVALRSNPLSQDSDADGIPDGMESQTTDCDGDEFPAIVDPDDDNDARADGDEPEDQRCNPDVDADGVRDGHERALVCITLPDCDADGLPDGDELAHGFDPLDADTYGANLPDAVMHAFALAGQNASADDDGDGIPDAWESENGLIDWGPFTPRPGRPDLLIEFVRVIDTGSTRVQGISFHSAYNNVEAMFESESTIDFQWTETTVHIVGMRRPPIVPSALDPYYADMLAEAHHAANPYVTTVFLNPQHDQSSVLHAGIAPIRGMIGAIDYGAHATLTFGSGNQQVGFTPFIESAIDGNRRDLFTASGWQNAGWQGNEMFVQQAGYTIYWTPYWYRGAPRVEFHDEDNTILQLEFRAAEIDTTDLASTIAHELGHTLGLCHIELTECRARLTPQEQLNGIQSTMHSNMAPGTLHFHPTEWNDVIEYVGCPPQGPVALVAQNASAAEIVNAKYGITLENILSVDTRACGNFTVVTSDLEAQQLPDGRPASLNVQALPAFDGTARWSIVYGVAFAGLMAGLGWVWRANRGPTRRA